MKNTVIYGGVLMPRAAMEVVSCWWSERTVAGDLRAVVEGRCSVETLYGLGELAAMSTPDVLPAIRLYCDAVQVAAAITRHLANCSDAKPVLCLRDGQSRR